MTAAKKTRTKRCSAPKEKPTKSRPGYGALHIEADDRATRYAIEVHEGRIVAGPHVRNACRRHLDDLIHGPGRGLRWDLDAARHIWRWWEGVLKLSEGQFEGIPFLLHPSQAFKLGSLMGWKRADGTRRFRRAYIEEGKGNGKSPFAGGLGLYGLTADGEAGAQIYAAGARKEQADILFRDAVKMVRKSPALTRRLKFAGGQGREYNIAYLKGGGAFFRPISREAGKSGSGPRPHFALCDEVHEHPSRDVMEMLERGFKFRRQPMLIMITNSGSDRQSVCWEEHQHAVRCAAGTKTPDEEFTYVGEVIDDSTFAYVCALDKGDDPLTDPSCWIKANPLLGVILTEAYLADVVAQAIAIPGKLNNILRLHFCCWTDSDTAWLSRETLENVLEDFDETIHHGKEVSLGLDLSGKNDLEALAHVVETGEVEMVGPDGETSLLPTFDVWIEAWTPEEGLADRAKRDSAPYLEWVKAGHLRTTPGPRIRHDYVAHRVGQVDEDFDVRILAYDRYMFESHFQPELDALGIEVPTTAHPQAGHKKSRPSEAQVAWAKANGAPVPDGLWMPGSLELLEAAIVDGRVRMKTNPVLISAIMSAAIGSDVLGNRWFEKSKATQRIDPLVSLAMAFGAAHAKGFGRVNFDRVIAAGGGLI